MGRIRRVVQVVLIAVMICSVVPVPALATEQAIDETSPAAVEVETTVESALQEEVSDTVVVNTSDSASDIMTPSTPQESAIAQPLAIIDEPVVRDQVITPIATPSPVKLAQAAIRADADVIISGFEVRGGKLIALELLNRTDKLVDLSQWQIAVVSVQGNDEMVCEVALTGYIYARRATVFTQEGMTVDVEREPHALPHEADWSCDDAAGQLAIIEVTTVGKPAEVVERVAVESARSALDGRWIRKTTGSYRTGEITDFVIPAGKGGERLLRYSEVYQPPTSAPLEIREVYVTPPQCAPADTSVLCARYVKVHNPTNEAIDLGEYRLRAGASTSSSSTANTTSLSGVIESGETRLIVSGPGRTLYLSAKEGAVWFEDRLGVMNYRQDSQVTPYKSADTVAHTGMSWALDAVDETWKWSVPSPDTPENIIEQRAAQEKVGKGSALMPCRADQYRHPETNRCRKVASDGSQLKPCKEGQYRSEETNRCRSIASAVRQLKPCRDDQYRSELTNRCRLISTASAQLVPCKDNQYRSEETNRCRNIASTNVPAAAFAVEPIADSGMVFAGWWVLVGALALALGYGAWEWRREIAVGLRAVGGIFRRTR